MGCVIVIFLSRGRFFGCIKVFVIREDMLENEGGEVILKWLLIDLGFIVL